MSFSLQLSHAAPASVDSPLLTIVLSQDPSLDETLRAVDAPLAGAIQRSIARRDFRGGRDETMLFVGGDTGAQRVLLVGRGSAPLTRAVARRAAAIAARQACKLGTGAMHLVLPGADADAVEGLALGAAAGSWAYSDLQTQPPEKDRRARLEVVTVFGADTEAVRAGFAAGVAVFAPAAVFSLLAEQEAHRAANRGIVLRDPRGPQVARRVVRHDRLRSVSLSRDARSLPGVSRDARSLPGTIGHCPRPDHSTRPCATTAPTAFAARSYASVCRNGMND